MAQHGSGRTRKLALTSRRDGGRLQNEECKQQAIPARSACDFCGTASAIHRFPTQTSGVAWHACSPCIALVLSEEWGLLIERILAAYAALQFIPEDEKAEFRHELTLAIIDNCSFHNKSRVVLQAV